MARDSTIAARMRRYRARKRRAGFVRRDVVLSPADRHDLDVRKRLRKLVDGRAALRRALVTINAPRPEPIDAISILRAFIEPEDKWRPHIEAFFTEVAPETIHDIVLGGLVGFPLLAASQKIWKLENGPNAAWIKEMAREQLATAA